MLSFLLRILFNSLAIYLVAIIVPGVIFQGDWKTLLLAGLILTIINLFIKPILRFVSLPFITLTFGLFSIIINMFVLWALVEIVPTLQITGFWTYFWATIIISISNFLTNFFIKKRQVKKAIENK